MAFNTPVLSTWRMFSGLNGCVIHVTCKATLVALDIIICYFFIHMSCLPFLNINNYTIISSVSTCGFEASSLEYLKTAVGHACKTLD